MTIIERYREDGEGVRRLFLVAEVTFGDRPADDPDTTNYYDDAELVERIGDWVEGALEDRDDRPAVRFHDVPQNLHVDMVAIAAKGYVEGPNPGAEADWRSATSPAAIAWGFIIEQNTSGGLTTDDLLKALERAGFPCPDGWGAE